jgi:outer membrane receptor protein involved in Fe transport
VDALLSWDLGSANTFTARYRIYRADDAGFGFVDPDEYSPNSPDIRITYPDQQFDKLTLGYTGRLNGAVVDQVSVKAYGQRNHRRLDLGIFIPFDPENNPAAGLRSDNRNFTDMRTYGGRVEAKKFIAGKHILTFGADFFNDNSRGWDTTVTAVEGFGPPSPDTSTTANVPDGTFTSFGLFAQGEVNAADRLTLILGARYQGVRAMTNEAPDVEAPVDESDQTVVGAFNMIYRLTDQLNVVGAIGRAFRSPDLVERFFNGVTPEGGAVQVPNPDLGPETSLNLDFGLRYRSGFLSAEGFVFRNEIRDGIRILATGDSINTLPVYTNVNVDKLLFSGVELSADVFLAHGFTVGGAYTHLSTRNSQDPDNPVGDTYSNNTAGSVRYTHPSDRVWISYEVRHNGERKDVLLGDNPIGMVLPAFTVHNIRASSILFRTGAYTQRIGLAVVNLTDELYAEFPNASFFRPEPRRSLILSLDAFF